MTQQRDTQGVWFGIAMFLMGLVAGVVLTFASNVLPVRQRAPIAAGGTQQPAQQQQPAPSVSVQERMVAYAKDIGLNEGKFTECIGTDKYKSLISENEAGGAQAGVSGTPGNIIYSLTTKKGFLVSGAQPIQNFQAVIDPMLANPNYAGTSSTTPATNVPPVDTATDHIRGNADADLAVIVYTDYQCPYCHRVHPTLQQLLTTYGDKMMLVYRHFPLSFHPEAEPLAIGAECANELGGSDAFWSFTDKVMES